MKKLIYIFNLVFILIGISTTVKGQTLTVTTTSTPACNYDGTATATVSGGTGPYTYYWYNSTDSLPSGNPIDSLTGGWYYVYVYDSLGNYGFSSVYVTPPFTLSGATTPESCSAQDGTATIDVTGGTMPYSFLWNNGETTQSITGLSSGYYSVTVTDAAGCKYSSSVNDTLNWDLFVSNVSPLTVTTSSTNDKCGNDGTATAIPSGGTAPYSYYWLTSPVQTTQTATGLASGYYEVNVSDASGCIQEKIPVNVGKDSSAIQISFNAISEMCFASDGSLTANPAGGTAPYTYLWSNGQTTQTISGLQAGWYSVTVTDATLCSVSIGITLTRKSSITLTFTISNANCKTADGSATVTPANGTAPYTYLWSNGQTSQTATGLISGWYSVTVTDANDCKMKKSCYVSEIGDCYVRIEGTVYEDLNKDCIRSSGEKGIYGAFVRLSSASMSISYYTSTTGYYGFIVDPGTYTISVQPMNYWNLICPVSPATYTVTLNAAGETSIGNNFGFEAIPGKQDLTVYACTDRACTGFDHHYYIRCINKGTIPMDVDLKAVLDQRLTYISAFPSADFFTPNTAEWSFNMDYMTSRNFWIATNVPTSVMQGQMLSDTVFIKPIAGDLTEWDNVYVRNQTISCAYDPNELLVFPEGLTSAGNITVNDTTLNYVIRFQNTGTDTAHTIVLRDTLDSNLDLLTFSEGAASHNYTVSIEGENVLVFTFNNIMLPDSNVNESESHGLVSFYINLKNGLPVGTQIKNTAGIYFDYNAPVITNTTVNTITSPTAVKELQKNDLKLFPNPTSGLVNLSFKNAIPRSITVMDVLGKIVLEQKIDVSETTLDMNFFKSGIYIITVDDGITTSQDKVAVFH